MALFFLPSDVLIEGAYDMENVRNCVEEKNLSRKGYQIPGLWTIQISSRLVGEDPLCESK